MVMAERQSIHREDLEAKVINADIASSKRGSIFGFVLSLIVICGGFVLVEQGKNVAGVSSILGSLASLVGVFVYSKQQQKKERVEKSTALEVRKNR
jgi:uncharacterized membrane protein